MTFVTGAISFAVISPMQMLMINAAKGSEMLASSAIQASANMGNALGAYLGGLPIAAGFGYTSPEYVGAGLAFTGVVFCFILLQKTKRAGAVSLATRKATIKTFGILKTNSSSKTVKHESIEH